MEYSWSRSLCSASLITHHRNEQVGDVGRAHLPKVGELATIDTIEKHDAATEYLALMHRLERSRGGELFGTHHHFHIARLEVFHAAIEHDAAAVEEHHIGEDVLDLIDLM